MAEQSGRELGAREQKHNGRTLKLKSSALARRDESASLTDAFECNRDLFSVTAGHAVCENVHGVAEVQEVQGCLQDTYVRLE